MLIKMDHDLYVDPAAVIAVSLEPPNLGTVVRLVLNTGTVAFVSVPGGVSASVLAVRIKNDINKALKDAAE